MEGVENSDRTTIPASAHADAVDPARDPTRAAEEALASLAEGAPDESVSRLRLVLQAALSQLGESTRLLHERDAQHEEMLAGAASEIQAVVHLLAGHDERVREEAVRRLRRVGEDLERMARASLPRVSPPVRPVAGA